MDRSETTDGMETEMGSNDFNEAVGQEFDFFGVDNLHYKLGDTVWLAVEDESDGYRSYLGSITKADRDDLIFPNQPFAHVKVEEYDTGLEEGFRLVDTTDSHIWLRIGTNNADDYYPSFVFEYSAKAA